MWATIKRTILPLHALLAICTVNRSLAHKRSTLFTLLVICTINGSLAQKNYTFDDLQPCTLNTHQIAQLGPDDELDPCIIFEVKPSVFGTIDKNMSTIHLVQVTPSNCGNHRDGAVTGVQFLNADNHGKGFAIGFNEDHYVSFHFISIVAGNPANLPEGEYDRRHAKILSYVLEKTVAPYIVGTCSSYSAIEKQPAQDFSAILMAQVGPPGFYTDNNPYVFGFHIDSDTYPLPNVQALGFLAQETERGPEGIPVKVIYRTQSEFFHSTCLSAINRLKSGGFTDLEEFLYDHTEDHDGDGEINQFDHDFLLDLADQACPPGSGEVTGFHPALFLCTLTEHDLILSRWLENGCRPTSVWTTAATWGWANNNPDKVPYLQGGGQWHAAFSYSDRFFESGQQFLQHNEDKFGYYGSYDQVVSYAIPILFSQHLQDSYRVADLPDPIADFSNNAQRELLRRDMILMNVESLFGPILFNEDQRNIGRGAAGTQWLPTGDNGMFNNALVAPLLQAEAATFIPALSALPCNGGSFINDTMRMEQNSLLAGSCSPCPVDTFTLDPSEDLECIPCPEGSGTDEMIGASMCIALEENLLPGGMLAFGYVAVGISWLLSFTFIIWQIYYRSDPVVKVSQIGFLLLICLGAIISSSTVIALSFEAGTDEDTFMATIGCTAAPFLYGIGWVLQYSSLSAKTYRIYMIMQANRQMRRVTITFFQVFSVVAVAIVIELLVLIVWTVKSPLVYERMEVSRSIDEESHIITINSIGQCVSRDPDLPIQYFAGPLLGFHIFLAIVTNVLLYNVKDVSDRYQEQKYMAFASALIFEVLVVGIPVVVAVRNNPVVTFIVIAGVIALDNIGILCLLFIPKIRSQIKGLKEGVGVGESIMKETYKKASMREDYRRNPSFSESQGCSGFDLPGRSTSDLCSVQKTLVNQSIVEEESKDLREEESENPLSTDESKGSLHHVSSKQTSIPGTTSD